MNVLIVEDDPMVEFIHRNYLERMNSFINIYSSSIVKDAMALITDKKINLILLDIHLKDDNGLEFLRMLRNQQINVEVILITAANEALSVQEGLHFGALDYLIKPFTFERFEQSIQLFLEKEKSLKRETIDQTVIDNLRGNSANTAVSEVVLEKGLSNETLELIIDTINSLNQPFKLNELVKKTDLSHVSIRKYLRYLETINRLKPETIYTKIGRPYKIYYFK
ncbi:response regulator [Enterococcus sp. BWT-B8]|uniref:response regulator n=1 Tax=unclassified Enterococcus TaxID=2608891 RepID=UPI001E2FE29D|nr:MULTISPECIES: response regulator [unclassified Enterococcus]MCB5953184.1 response regulator [Enterococcus sp. BWT-B8]MCB5953773.1 response regulator [Enterococcus sp. CWB-B31]